MSAVETQYDKAKKRGPMVTMDAEGTAYGGSGPSTARARFADESDEELELPDNLERDPMEGMGPRRRNTLADKLLKARLAVSKTTTMQKKVLGAGRKTVTQWQSEGAESLPLGCLFEEEEDTPPMRVRAEVVFGFHAHNSEVIVGKHLAEAFLLLDIPYPDEEILADALQRKFQGRNSLDREDFVSVVVAYQDTVATQLEKVFRQISGYVDNIDSNKVVNLLEEAGVPLMPGVKQELALQLSAEQKDKVNFHEFKNIYEDIISRASLTVGEHGRISDLFEATEDWDGTIGAEDLSRILSWNEAFVSVAGENAIQRIVEITARRAASGRLSLNFRGWMAEYKNQKSLDGFGAEVAEPVENLDLDSVRFTGSAVLVAARFLHYCIADGLVATMQKVGSKGKSMSLQKILAVVEEVGFLGATVESLEHFIGVCRFEPQRVYDFDQIYTLIFRFCNADGFTDSEEKDLTDLFRKFDDDGSGTLEASEVGPVIRWLGYQPTQYRVYSFAEDVGLNENSAIDLIQFRKMVSNYYRLSLRRVKEAFKQGYLPGSEDKRRIVVGDLGQLLTMVGYEITHAEVTKVIDSLGGPDDPLDFLTFKKLEINHRKHVRKTMEENGGVSNAEYNKYQSYFHHNKDGEGHITQKAMRNLLGKLFPSNSLDRSRHVRIAQLVKEADVDGNKVFDFEEFVWLMNRVTEVMDRDSLVKGLMLRKQLGYTSAEVKHFKELYQMSDEDMSGYIDFEELCKLFLMILPLDGEGIRELSARFRQVCSMETGELDFWEFLTFMRSVQRDNWRNITGVLGRRTALRNS